MPTYTGPVPPMPGPQDDAARWTNWWSYQTILQNLRYEDERAARAVVLDAQHAEKMAAEAACAASNQALAAAQRDMARVFNLVHTTPPAEVAQWTEAQLVRGFMLALGEAGQFGSSALLRARASMLALGDLYPPARPTAEGGPDLPPLVPPPKPAASTADTPGPTGDQILPPAKKPQVPL